MISISCNATKVAGIETLLIGITVELAIKAISADSASFRAVREPRQLLVLDIRDWYRALSKALLYY